MVGLMVGNCLGGASQTPSVGVARCFAPLAPEASRPFVVDGPPQVVGVGESIGCVSPLVGDGVVHGMRSVRLLLDCWDDPEAYTGKILG